MIEHPKGFTSPLFIFEYMWLCFVVVGFLFFCLCSCPSQIGRGILCANVDIVHRRGVWRVLWNWCAIVVRCARARLPRPKPIRPFHHSFNINGRLLNSIGVSDLNHLQDLWCSWTVYTPVVLYMYTFWFFLSLSHSLGIWNTNKKSRNMIWFLSVRSRLRLSLPLQYHILPYSSLRCVIAASSRSQRWLRLFGRCLLKLSTIHFNY